MNRRNRKKDVVASSASVSLSRSQRKVAHTLAIKNSVFGHTRETPPSYVIRVKTGGLSILMAGEGCSHGTSNFLNSICEFANFSSTARLELVRNSKFSACRYLFRLNRKLTGKKNYGISTGRTIVDGCNAGFVSRISL